MARVRYPNKTHYSRHFSRKELDCKCGCRAPKQVRRNLRKLAVRLEKLRRHLDGPVWIVNGYRCYERNRFVNGAVNSQHLTGKAADLQVPAGQQDNYVRAAEKVPAFRRGGIGIYPNGGVHVDYRSWRARWSSWRGSR